MRQHIIVNFKRICGDNTQYGYVSDTVFRTWEKCPTCFNAVVKMRPLHPVAGPLRPRLDKPQPPHTQKKIVLSNRIVLRDALKER